MLIASLLLFQILYAPPSRDDASGWEQVFDYVAPDVPRFHSKITQISDERLQYRAIKAIYAQTKKRIAGIHESSNKLSRVNGVLDKFVSIAVVPIQGTTDGVIGWFSTDDPFESDCVTIAFYRVKGRMKSHFVPANKSNAGSCPVDSAVICNGKLVIGCIYFWYSIGLQQPDVQTYSHKGKRWQLEAEKISPLNNPHRPKLELSSDGKSIRPLVIRAFQYPHYMDVSHGNAAIEWQERWKFVDGQPKFVWRKELDSPYRMLDKLVHAIKLGDQAFIRDHCLTSRICANIAKLRQRFPTVFKVSEHSRPSVSVWFPGNVSDGGSRRIGIHELKTIFHFAQRKSVWVVSRLEPLKDE